MKYLFWVITWMVPLSNISAQPPQYNDSMYFIQDSVLIPTKSGIEISAIIVRKKSVDLPVPVVLFYTTYYQGPGDAVFAKRSADRDFVGVVAYSRGIRTNLKYYQPFEHESTDTYDIIDWLTKQSWCNGSVGMFGGSYTGFAQWAAVKHIHPALKTIVPQVAVMPGFDFPMENNVPLSHILGWSNDNIYKRKPLPRSLPFEYFNSGVSFDKWDSLAGYNNPYFQKWLQHPNYDSYWQNMIPTAEEFANLNIPVLSTTGYYDGSQISTLKYYQLHNQYNKNAEHYFVIGPYDHWGGQRRAAKNLMGYEIDSVANLSMMNLAYEWLEYILKGKPKPDILKNKFNYQVMGTNEWKHAASAKAITNDTLTFFLSKDKLSRTKSAAKNFIQQKVDFRNREDQNNFYVPEIIFDSLDKSNGVVLMTDRFDHDFLMNGSFTGLLQATINKKDMDISMALFELTNENKYFFLTRYVGRASYARDNKKRQLLRPNQKEKIPIGVTRFVSKKINRGSRLVILLNVNKHPFEIINYGSGKNVSSETIKDAGSPLLIKWHNDSFIKIPVWKN